MLTPVRAAIADGQANTLPRYLDMTLSAQECGPSPFGKVLEEDAFLQRFGLRGSEGQQGAQPEGGGPASAWALHG